MSYTPISNTVPQYSKNASGASASGYYLKFYADGTTTPINMATDSTGGTTLAKCQLNTLGYPVNGSSDVFIPHIDQDYKLALYENATDADNNTLASAAWVVDDIPVQFSTTDTVTNDNGTSRTVAQWFNRQAQVYDTVADLVAETNLSSGDYVTIKNYSISNNSGAMYGEIVASGTGTADGGSYINLTGSATQFKQYFDGGVIDVKKFGAEGDNSTDDTAAIQAALDYLGSASLFLSSGGKAKLPKGVYVTSDPLLFKSSWITLEGDGEYVSTISFTGTAGEAAITTATVDDVYSYNGARRLAIRVNAANTYGINFSRCQGACFESLVIQLLSDNTVCVYGEGNGAGSAPYYNKFDNLFFAGAWTPGAPTTDCVAFRFALNDPTKLDAPNSNVISNIKRLAGFNKAFDIQAGNANMFTNIGAESIGDYVFDFSTISASYTGTATSGTANSITDTAASFPVLSNGTLKITGGTGAGTVALILNNTATTVTLSQSQSVVFDNTSVYEIYNGKCSGNKVMNLRHEGTSTTAMIRNNYGGNNNVVSNVFSTGATTRWTNPAKDPDFLVNPVGNGLTALTFSAENLAANTTTTLSPIGGGGLSIAGGVRIPRSGNVVAVSTAVNDMGGSALGNATVKLIHNGNESTSFTHTINVNNRFGYSEVADVIDDPVIRDKNIHVTIDTDASWNATTADMSVTVWIAH